MFFVCLLICGVGCGGCRLLVCSLLSLLLLLFVVYLLFIVVAVGVYCSSACWPFDCLFFVCLLSVFDLLFVRLICSLFG